MFFSSTAGGEPAFYRVQIKGHRLERVASLKDVKRPTSGTFASWTGLTPDDSPLALRDISNYEIYALDWQHRNSAEGLVWSGDHDHDRRFG